MSISLQDATQRFLVAEREFRSAAHDLQALVAARASELIRDLRATHRPRRTWEEAEQLSRQVIAAKRETPDKTQRQLAEQFGISRDLVSYYLSPGCKAAGRVSTARTKSLA